MFSFYFENDLFIRHCHAIKPKGSIVYIHGLGESSRSFEELIQASPLENWDHWALDLEGYGKSFWGRQPKSLLEHAESLADWIAAKGLRPAILLGHSMGGVIGLLLCERHPELIRAFINVEGNITLNDCTYSSLATNYSEEAFHCTGWATILNAIFTSGQADLALRGYFASLMMCDPRSFYLNSLELVELSSSQTIAQRLGALRIPQLFFAGSPKGTGETSQAQLRKEGIELNVIKDAGHWPFLDQPQVFVEGMKAFLLSLPPLCASP